MMVLESESPCVDTAAAGRKQGKPSCLSAGVCLCTGRGVRPNKIRIAICGVLKIAFPRGDLRKQLYNGFAVLQLRRVRSVERGDVGCPGGICSSYVKRLKNINRRS